MPGLHNSMVCGTSKEKYSSDSPRPFANAEPLSRKYGTSEPSWIARECNRLSLAVCLQNEGRWSNTVAASELPPPSPAPTGMFFWIHILTPSWIPQCSLNKLAALKQMLRSSRGTMVDELVMAIVGEGSNEIVSNRKKKKKTVSIL